MRIKPAPKQLFFKGKVDLLSDDLPKLAIVGSRRMTDYGQKVIEKWMPVLVQKEVVIVSGFMYGVDQSAHKACLENGGKTIAVLGWGIDGKVAGEDERLYQKIIEVNSLIVSEYEGEYPADKWTFPQRNRIVAGIADAVLVVEAAERSGSLITARLARRFGKKLMAVPGPVTSKVSEGTNNLINNGQAVMVTTAEDVLKEMGLGLGQISLDYETKFSDSPVLEVLEKGGKSVDELARILKVPVKEIMEMLFELEMEGAVKEKSGKFVLVS